MTDKLTKGYWVGAEAYCCHPPEHFIRWELKLPEDKIAELQAKYDEACLVVLAAGEALRRTGVKVPTIKGNPNSPAAVELFTKLTT